MTVYNGVEFLKEQLDSVRLQTHQPDEVLISDDCSSDSTRALIDEYIRAHGLEDSWFLLLNDRNLGYTENFLVTAERATGDILFFCDQDDAWELNKVQIVLEYYSNTPTALSIITAYRVIDQHGRSADTLYTRLRARRMKFLKVSFLEQLRRNYSVGFALTVKRDFYLTLVPVIRRLGLTFDVPVGLFASKQDGYFALGMPLVRRRVHQGNISGPMYSIGSRLRHADRHIEGRAKRVMLWKAVGQELQDCFNAKEQAMFGSALTQLELTLFSLERRNSIPLLKMLVSPHPAIGRFMVAIDLIVIFFASRFATKKGF